MLPLMRKETEAQRGEGLAQGHTARLSLGEGLRALDCWGQRSGAFLPALPTLDFGLSLCLLTNTVRKF